MAYPCSPNDLSDARQRLTVMLGGAFGEESRIIAEQYAHGVLSVEDFMRQTQHIVENEWENVYIFEREQENPGSAIHRISPGSRR